MLSIASASLRSPTTADHIVIRADGDAFRLSNLPPSRFFLKEKEHLLFHGVVVGVGVGGYGWKFAQRPREHILMTS